jgi:hypothetical protein
MELASGLQVRTVVAALSVAVGDARPIVGRPMGKW